MNEKTSYLTWQEAYDLLKRLEKKDKWPPRKYAKWPGQGEGGILVTVERDTYPMCWGVSPRNGKELLMGWKAATLPHHYTVRIYRREA